MSESGEDGCLLRFPPIRVPRSLGTHDGTFHADEVTAAALLLLVGLIDRDKILRSRDPVLLARCDFLCDVGGVYDEESHLFDHHQIEYTGTMSSAGQLLRYLEKKQLLPPSLCRHLDETLIAGVDAHDNGLDLQIPGVCTYSHIIANFNPVRHDASLKEQEEAFFEALLFAEGHLRRVFNRYAYSNECRALVSQAMERASQQGVDYLLFDRSIPWMESFFSLGGVSHRAKFLLMPSGDHWKLRGIPPTYEQRMQVRQPLPQSWAGLLEEQLRGVAGEGALFCHKGRFVSVWQTKEDALRAVHYVLAQNSDQNLLDPVGGQ